MSSFTTYENFFNVDEDGSNKSMRNARQFLPHYVTSHPSRLHSTLPQRIWIFICLVF